VGLIQVKGILQIRLNVTDISTVQFCLPDVHLHNVILLLLTAFVAGDIGAQCHWFVTSILHY